VTNIILNHLDDELLAKLEELARSNRVSVEVQAERLLAEAVSALNRRRRRLEIVDRIAAMTPDGVKQTDSTILLREDRDR
jgi:ElaB/YqjD/DUF883 family membrane-anchored ribosome-binding protein